MHLHTHMHTHTNTHTHMHKYTHIHKRTLKYTLKYIHTNTHTAFSHAFMRTLRRMDAPEISLGSIKKWGRKHAPVQACSNGAVANVGFTSKLVDRFFALSDLFGITNPASPRFGVAI